MEEQRNVVVHLEVRFGTAFIIGLGLALATLLVMLIPWVLLVLFVIPLSAS